MRKSKCDCSENNLNYCIGHPALISDFEKAGDEGVGYMPTVSLAGLLSEISLELQDIEGLLFGGLMPSNPIEPVNLIDFLYEEARSTLSRIKIIKEEIERLK